MLTIAGLLAGCSKSTLSIDCGNLPSESGGQPQIGEAQIAFQGVIRQAGLFLP